MVLLMSFVHDEKRKMTVVMCLGLSLGKKLTTYILASEKIAVMFLGLHLYLEHFKTWESTHASLTL